MGYERELGLRIGFSETSWGEDQYFSSALRSEGVSFMAYPDKEFLVLHTQHGRNLSRSIAQSLVDPSKWTEFVAQTMHWAQIMMQRLPGLNPPVSIGFGWSAPSFVSPDIRSAVHMGPARILSPEPAPPPKG